MKKLLMLLFVFALTSQAHGIVTVLYKTGDAGTEASEAEAKQLVSDKHRIAFVALINDGNHPKLNAIRTNSNADGGMSFLSVGEEGGDIKFEIRFKHTLAVAEHSKNTLQLLRWMALYMGATEVDSEKVNISLSNATRWATAAEAVLSP